MSTRHIKATKSAPSHRISQTFSINAPSAVTVELVGTFTNWQANPVSLGRRENGLWSVTLPLEAGEYRYRFLIDDEWRDDPECTVRVPNPYGSHDSVLRIANGDSHS